jgi:small subunit ribosomal protein S6
MKNYELFLILNSKKDEAAAQKAIREVEAVLNKYGAKLLKNNGGENARLAHAINKRIDSYQAVLEIQAEEKDLAEIRKQLALVEDVLRAGFFALQPVAA